MLERRYPYFLIGLATGAGVLALIAPKSGRDTRKSIAHKVYRGKKLLAKSQTRVRRSATESFKRVNGVLTAAMQAGKNVAHYIH